MGKVNEATGGVWVGVCARIGNVIDLEAVSGSPGGITGTSPVHMEPEILAWFLIALSRLAAEFRHSPHEIWTQDSIDRRK